ncbi:MAG: rhodanese-like domain-containing protein [Thioalkalivibrionaceae bacterium]
MNQIPATPPGATTTITPRKSATHRIGSFLLLAAVVWLLTISTAHAADDGFPGRPIYFHVPVMELDELKAAMDRDEVTVVDVRTRYEFDTLRIEGAEHVSFDDPAFVEKVRAIHSAAPDKKIVFYCRGHSCFLSYQAVERMKAAGFDRSISMDAGIFDWAENYPEQTALFGVSPIDTADLIDFNQFKARLLPPLEFSARVQREGARALDIRRPFERDGISLFVGREENIGAEDTDRMIRFLEQVRDSGETLYVFDISGHEVKAFQYTLEAVGVENYYFMDGGAKALFSDFERL